MIAIRTLAASLGLLMLLGGAAGAADDAGADAPTILITGANRGIGLEFVRQSAERGWQVIATARKPAEAADLQALAAGNPRIVIEQLDVTDFEQVDALAAKYQDRPIDVLLNNAGISGAMQDQMFGRHSDWAVFERILRTNTIAPLKMAEAFLPHLLASGQKKLVNVSSSEGSIGSVTQPRMYFYRASKAALNMEMRNVALSQKGKGLLVANINPGMVDTDMLAVMPKRMLRPKEDAVKDLIRIMDQLDADNTGRFWNFDGTELPW